MTKYTVSNLKLSANKIMADTVICLILLAIAFIGYKLENGLMILAMSLISGMLVIALNNFLFYFRCRKHLNRERG